MKRSSAWTRRLSAGDDSASSSAAGFDRAEPRDLNERLDGRQTGAIAAPNFLHLREVLCAAQPAANVTSPLYSH
jgi:hypothetical protein